MTQQENERLAALVAIVERMDEEAKNDRVKRDAAETRAQLSREKTAAATTDLSIRVAQLEVKMDREILGHARLERGVEENTKATTAATAAHEAKETLAASSKTTIMTVVAIAGFFATIIGSAIANLVQSNF